jgi:hypothetical protein
MEHGMDMNEDLLERLHARALYTPGSAVDSNLFIEAAALIDRLTRERDEARRALDALIHLIRQHRCNCDGVMPVGECVDSGRCGCSAALLTRAISTGEADESL